MARRPPTPPAAAPAPTARASRASASRPVPPEGRRFTPSDPRGVATRFPPGDNPVGAATRFRKGEAPPAGRPFVRGYDPRREPGKALAGRKTEAFKALCRNLVTSPETRTQVRGILADGKHPHFVGVLRTLCEYGFGKAPASVDVTSGGQSIAPGRLSPEEIAAEVAAIAARIAGED